MQRELPGTAGGGIQIFPLNVFKDVLSTDAPDKADNVFATRAGQNLIADPAIIKIDGTPQSVAPDNANPGKLTVNTSGQKGAVVTADYAIDRLSNQLVPRQNIQIKDSSTPGSGVPYAPALGKNDILYFGTDNGSLYAVQLNAMSTRSGSRTVLRSTVKWRWYLGDPGVTALTGGTAGIPVGTPAVGNDVVYFTVNAGSNGYVMALRADPTFSLNLGTSLSSTDQVTVLQYDSMNPGGEPQPIMGTADQGADPNAPQFSSFVVDYDTGKLTFRNFRPNDNAALDISSSQDIIVRFTAANNGNGAGSEQDQVHSAFGNTYQNDKWSNLLWCVQLPLEDEVSKDNKPFKVTTTASPMLFGNMLYVSCTNNDGTKGKICAIDVDKVAQNYTLQVWSDVKSKNVGWDNDAGPGVATVAGTSGMLAVASSEGLSIVHSPSTLVADSNRLVELDAAGNITWSCDGTYAVKISNSTYASDKTPFNRPAIARRSPAGGIVAADTGNNRVVWIDKGGKVLWSVTDFSDPNSKLPKGSPLTLNRPLDVWMWTADISGQASEYHYLITDSGNYRVLEIAVRWNSTTNAYENQLVWCTNTVAQGKKYLYTSAQPVIDPTNGAIAMCAISNYKVTTDGSAEGPGGSLVKVNRTNGHIIQSLLKLGTYSLVKPTFFNRNYRTANNYDDVIVDAKGVHVASYDNTQSTPLLGVRHYTPRDYGKPLFVVHAQMLPNGNVLVTNSAASSAGMGEIFELVPDPSDSTKLKLVDNSAIQGGTTSYGLHQPSSAERVIY